MNRTLGQLRRAKFAALRAAKERKRLAGPPPEREPQFERWFPLEIIVRDKRDPRQVGSFDFRSVRDAARRLAVVAREYLPYA